MTQVNIKRVKELRDRYARCSKISTFGPVEVFATEKDLLAILNDYLEFREAEEESEGRPRLLQLLEDGLSILNTAQGLTADEIALEGTVR